MNLWRGLDPSGRREVMKTIEGLRRIGLLRDTVSHSMEDVARSAEAHCGVE